jgi:hypothetical protein
MNLNEIVILSDCGDVLGYLKNKIRYLQGRNIDSNEVELILKELEVNGLQITLCMYRDRNIAILISRLKTLLT